MMWTCRIAGKVVVDIFQDRLSQVTKKPTRNLQGYKSQIEG